MSILFLGMLMSSCFVCRVAYSQEFRTITGAGNTLDGSGTPGSPLLRLAPSAYEDGDSEPRGGGLDAPLKLPGARFISNLVSKQRGSIPEPAGVSNIFWTWGQFLDHDIDLTKETEIRFDIPIPNDDTNFGPLTSLPFKRSGFVPGGPRQQKNDITSFIDGSQVYGSTDAFAESLREAGGNGCHLITSPGDLLKFENGKFIAGDERAGEQPGLTALHTVFLREHNRLATMLLQKFRNMDNETCYQLGRLIVGTQIQIITVKEFLPILVGRNPLAGVRPIRRNVGIYNEFSSGCFRFGHSMVTDALDVRNDKYCKTKSIQLKDSFFNPTLFQDVGVDAILRGLVSQRAEMLDAFIVPALRDSLFQGQPGSRRGLDLAAFNMQRGRDHGVPGICDLRKAIRVNPSKNLKYKHLTKDRTLIQRLTKAYGRDVCVVDLWIAGLVERRKGQGIVGPTCKAVIKRQFRELIGGDRFSMTNLNWKPYGLGKNPNLGAGLKLSRVTLGKLIALNTELSELSARNVFLVRDAPRSAGC